MPETCESHPSRKARWTCEICSRRLCKDCRLPRRRPALCSDRCSEVYGELHATKAQSSRGARRSADSEPAAAHRITTPPPHAKTPAEPPAEQSGSGGRAVVSTSKTSRPNKADGAATSVASPPAENPAVAATSVEGTGHVGQDSPAPAAGPVSGPAPGASQSSGSRAPVTLILLQAATVILVAVVLAAMVNFHGLAGTTSEVVESEPVERQSPSLLVSPRLSLRDGQRLRGSPVSLRGEASYGDVVALLVDDVVVATAVVRSDRFRFENVEIPEGDSTLKVVAYSRDGPAVESPAIATHYELTAP